MKIHWLSNAPWSSTGYGNITRLFVPRLHAAGHEMSITAFWGLEGAILDWNGIRVMPKAFDPYGNDIAAANAHVSGTKILITCLDAWVANPESLHLYDSRWLPWFPLDSEPTPNMIIDTIKKADIRLVYSQYACRQLDQLGMDYEYLPLGVDTKIFQPKPMEDARKFMKLPQDAFVVGMVAANKGNPSRKAFCEQIAAFQLLRRHHSDAIMYLHTYDGSSGYNASVNLLQYIEGLGLKIGVEIFICNQHQYALSYGDEYMKNFYNSMNILTNCSLGEGFGIPIMEAQACGTPVLVGDWTSMSEIFFSGQILNKSDAVPFYNPLNTFQFLPNINAIYNAMEAEYRKPSSRAQARAGALAYDVGISIEKYWLPFLKTLPERLNLHDPPAADNPPAADKPDGASDEK